MEHVLGAGGVLDDTALRGQIALQDGDAAVGALGVVKAVDDILAGDFDAQTLGLFLQDLVAVLVEAVLLQVFQVSPSVLPVTVITSRCSMDLISSITRGTPPA